MSKMTELNQDELEIVAGGPLPLPLLIVAGAAAAATAAKAIMDVGAELHDAVCTH